MVKKSLNALKIKALAAQYLLDYTPKTVINVKDKLEKLIEESRVLEKEAKEFIKEYEKILG